VHLLGANETVDAEDMKRFQFDVHDCAAEVFLPALFSAFREEEPEGPVADALALLKAWDFRAVPDSVPATIWVSWFLSVQETIWRHVWRRVGVDLNRRDFIEDYSCDPPTELLERVVREQFYDVKRGWLDVPEGEALYALVRESFRRALKSLAIKAGEDMKEWKWGRFSRARFESLSRTEDLSRKNVPIGGTVFTLNPGGDLNEMDRGATLRFIASFADPDTMLAVYPGGQSEDGSSPHYADLFELWLKGEYVQLRLCRSPDGLSEAETESVTVLKPG
jgi:penicillin amidase